MSKTVKGVTESSRAPKLMATVAAAVLVAALPVGSASATAKQDLHCPDYNTAPGKIEVGKLPATISLDRADIKVVLGSDKTFVTFMDSENEPLAVEYCIKAGEGASGKKTGTEGSVTWKTEGGQTPAVSYVVVYGVESTEDENDDNETPDTPTDEDDNDGDVLGDDTSKGGGESTDDDQPAKENGGVGNLPETGLGTMAGAAVTSIVAIVIAASAALHYRAAEVKKSVSNFFTKKK